MYSHQHLSIGVVIAALIAGASSLRAGTVIDLDLTKGPPVDPRVAIEVGVWDKGWRVTGDLDRILIDAGHSISDAYLEIV